MSKYKCGGVKKQLTKKLNTQFNALHYKNIPSCSSNNSKPMPWKAGEGRLALALWLTTTASTELDLCY